METRLTRSFKEANLDLRFKDRSAQDIYDILCSTITKPEDVYNVPLVLDEIIYHSKRTSEPWRGNVQNALQEMIMNCKVDKAHLSKMPKALTERTLPPIEITPEDIAKYKHDADLKKLYEEEY